MSRRVCGVRLGAVLVGYLVQAHDGRIGMAFEEEYRGRTDRPVLGQLLEDDLARTYWGRRPGELPSFFANMLPEGSLRDVLEQAAGVARGDDLGLLMALASDLPGAVELSPADSREAATASPRPPEGSDMGEPLRFSLAGLQLKFSMVRAGDRLTLPASGRGGDWIVKVDTGQFEGVVENEHAILEWAAEADFQVPERFIASSDALQGIERYIREGARGLAVRRYDRRSGVRIHQEDFAQVVGCPPTPSGRKYDFKVKTLLRLVRAITGDEGYEEALRRLAFIVASGNADAHLKNWSLVYPDGFVAELGPLYDQVCTIAWGDQVDRELAMKMGGTRHFGEVDARRVRRVAELSGGDPDRAEELVQSTLERLREAWPRVAPRVEMLPRHRRALEEHWQRVPLLAERGGLVDHPHSGD